MTRSDELGRLQILAVGFWNALYPPGTEVNLTEEGGNSTRTRTRSRAWQLGDGTPVVQVDGRSGGFRLTRIRPVTMEDAII